MQIKDVDKLKAWLLKKLEPLCDADPAALAKYVVALLRKEKPKSALKDLCIDQLEVFLAKETTSFVDKLFRCLESESYMKGEDPPPSPPPPAQSQPPPISTVPLSVSTAGVKSADRLQQQQQQRSDSISSSGTSRPDFSERQQSETDNRHKEVDDDDRDFRRSKKHDSDLSGSGSGGVGRKIVAPIGGSGAGGRVGLGKKRNLNPVLDGGISKRRVVIDLSRGLDSSDAYHRPPPGVNSATMGSGRRPVRERLGPRPDDSRSDRGRRSRRSSHSSSSNSSNSSSSSSDSDSGSSTGSSNKRRPGRKRRKTAGSSGAGGGGTGNEGKKKQRCKDYDKKGFCILGENCPYDHGLAPLVIGGGMNPYGHPSSGMPPVPIGVPTLPPPQELLVPSLIPPTISGRISPPSSSKSETYNPEDPGLSSTTSSRFIPTHIAPPPPPLPLSMRPLFPPPHMAGLMPRHGPPHLPPFPPHHPFPPSNMLPPNHFPPHMRPRPPLGTGRGPLKPSDALIVRKIPKDQNTITKLSSHFEKFGTIVNLKVRYEGDLEGALVQFSSPAEAKKAHDSAEAVLNNRFIKVYYLRKEEMGPPPMLSEFSLEAPVAVAVSSICSESSTRMSPILSTVSSSEPLPSIQPTPDSSGGLTAEVEQQLKWEGSPLPNHDATTDKKIREARSVRPAPLSKPASFHQTATTTISPINSTAGSQPHPHPSTQQKHHHQKRSTEAAKKNLELQKKTQVLLQKQIEQQKLLISKLEKTGKHLSVEEKNTIMKSLKTLSANISKLTEAANKAVLSQKQEQQKEDLTSKQQPHHPVQKAGLKEKAEALRKEAHKLGLLSSPSQPLPTSGKGRGQKNPSDLRNKVKSKPRQLLVIGAKDRDQLTTYFESFGGLDAVEVDPTNGSNLIFTFRNSSSANQVVKSSSTFQGKPLIMKWYTPKARQSSLAPTVTSSVSPLSYLQNSKGHTPMPAVERQESEPPPTTPTLMKLDPQELHLVEDSASEDEGEERSWRR